MKEDEKPDPDEILKAIQKEEIKKTSGKLKIFFGMSAGVGKTYAMLEEAQRRFKEGVFIVIGTINTHGRKETEELLKGMPIIAEKWVKYKDTVFEEMDIEALLQLKPSVVLVDELAHTNVPGSKHAKRWQDVIELLDHGIDVYTTLNVQHIESRKDLVESFTDIQIRETVPDLILERASTIELIDISPEELLQRLKDGKVYLGPQSTIAANHFFKEDTLTALREIALRLTAEKVDHDLHSLLSLKKGWKTREKLMVAISSSPTSKQLIRRTRRRAFELDAHWIAVFVDTGKILSDKEQSFLTAHFNLVQELGGEVVTTHDTDIASALQNIAEQKNITQLIMGRAKPRQFWDFFHKSLVDQIESKNQQLDLVILRPDKLIKVYQSIFPTSSLSSNWFYGYGIALATVVGIVILGSLLLPFIGYKSVGQIFLLGILFLGFFVGQGPIFLAAVLSTIAWNFFFISPLFSFAIPQAEDLILTLIYFFTAAILGLSTSHIHKQDHLLKLREKRLQHLYEIEKEIANATDFQTLRRNIATHLQSIFNAQFDILIKDPSGRTLIFDSEISLLQQEKEQIVAQWSLQNGKMAGWSSTTLPSAKGLYFPIHFSQNRLGVLVYLPQTERTLSISEINFLQTVTQQLGTYLEHYSFEKNLDHQSYINQAEKLHVSLLHSISQRFHSPLNKMFEAIQKLKQGNFYQENQSIFEVIEKSEKNLELMINNLLIFAELESGCVKLNKQQGEINHFIENSIQEFQTFLKKNPVSFSFTQHPVFLSFDARLLKIVLKNILMYIEIASLPAQEIHVETLEEKETYKIMLSQKNMVIPPHILGHLFEKTDDITAIQFKNHIEGLAIAKTILEVIQGKIEVKTLEPTGVIFSLYLPLSSEKDSKSTTS